MEKVPNKKVEYHIILFKSLNIYNYKIDLIGNCPQKGSSLFISKMLNTDSAKCKEAGSIIKNVVNILSLGYYQGNIDIILYHKKS